MSRFEENKLLFDRIVKMSEHKPEGTFEEMMVFQAAAIASVLTDISKSVAVIADRAENERLKKALEQEPKTDYISIDNVMSVFDDFMCGEVDEDGTNTFLEMLKGKAESEENHIDHK